MPASTNQLTLSLTPERRVLQVHELSTRLQELFDGEFRELYVAGEISGCRIAASGHYYFALKDDRSQLKCVLFKGTARFTRAKPGDGLAVIARGHLEVYAARGEYQLIVDALEPQGAGVLQLAFEQMKKKLAAEGLFEASRKRPLPKLPRRIGVITSPAGAVVRDILHVLERRFRGVHVRLFPAQVQGEGSVEQVCAGLRFLGEGSWAEVIILARGGGSLEDLWTFNEEAVARAIAATRVPVISAIGHETDFTIADFVADYRAPTPSVAAEVIICTSASLLEGIAANRSKAERAMRYQLLLAARNLQDLGVERAARVMGRRISSAAQRTDEFDGRLQTAARSVLAQGRRRFHDVDRRLHAADLRLTLGGLRHRAELLAQRLLKSSEAMLWRADARRKSLALHLEQLSPFTVLERGYAIVERPDGSILRVAAEAAAGDRLRVRLHRGELETIVSK